MIKSNPIVLFIKVPPSGKSELARAGTCHTKSNDNRATRASSPDWKCGPDGSSCLQEQETAPQRCDKVDGDNGSCNKNWNRADLRYHDLWPLGRQVGSRASGLVRQKLGSFGRHARGTS